MDDQERREQFWMQVYKLVLDKNLKLHMKDKDVNAVNELARKTADAAVASFRSTDAFK